MPTQLTGKSVYVVSWGLQRWDDQMDGTVNRKLGDIKVFSNKEKAVEYKVQLSRKLFWDLKGLPSGVNKENGYPEPTDKDLGFWGFFDDDDDETFGEYHEVSFGVQNHHVGYYDDDEYDRDARVEKDAGYVLLEPYCIDADEARAKVIAKPLQRVKPVQAANPIVQAVKPVVQTTKAVKAVKPAKPAKKPAAKASKPTTTKSTKASTSTSNKKRKLQETGTQSTAMSKPKTSMPTTSPIGQSAPMNQASHMTQGYPPPMDRPPPPPMYAMPPQMNYYSQAPQNQFNPAHVNHNQLGPPVPHNHPAGSNVPHNQPSPYEPYGVIKFDVPPPPQTRPNNVAPVQTKMKVSQKQNKPNAAPQNQPLQQGAPHHPPTQQVPYSHPNPNVPYPNIPYYPPVSNVPYNNQPNPNVKHRPLMPYDPNTQYHPGMPNGPPMAYRPPMPYGAAPMPYQHPMPHPGPPPPMNEKASKPPPKNRPASKQK